MDAERKKTESTFWVYAAGLSSILDLSGDDHNFRKLVQRRVDYGNDWEAIGSDFEAVGEDLREAIIIQFRKLSDKKKVETVRDLISAAKEKEGLHSNSDKDDHGQLKEEG